MAKQRFKEAHVAVYSEQHNILRHWTARVPASRADVLFGKVRDNLVLPAEVPGQIYGVHPSKNAHVIALMTRIVEKTLQGLNATDDVGALAAVAKIRPFFLVRYDPMGIAIDHVDTVTSASAARDAIIERNPEFLALNDGGVINTAFLKTMIEAITDIPQTPTPPHTISDTYDELSREQARAAFDVLREYVDLGRVHTKEPYRLALERIAGHLYETIPRPKNGLMLHRLYVFERDVFVRLTAAGRLDLEHRTYMSWSRTAQDAIASLGPFHLYRIVVEHRDLIYVIVRQWVDPIEIVVDIEALCVRAGYQAKTHLWNGGEAEFITRHETPQSIPFENIITIDFGTLSGPTGLRERTQAAYGYLQNKLDEATGLNRGD